MKKEAECLPMCEREIMVQEPEVDLFVGLPELYVMQPGGALEEWETVLEEELEEMEEDLEAELDFLRSQQQGSWLDEYLDAIEEWEEEDE